MCHVVFGAYVYGQHILHLPEIQASGFPMFAGKMNYSEPMVSQWRDHPQRDRCDSEVINTYTHRQLTTSADGDLVFSANNRKIQNQVEELQGRGSSG